jgi:TonB family protein
MIENKLIKCGFCFFAIVLCITSVSAQENKCGIKINVAEFGTNEPVKKAQAFIQDTQTNTLIQAKAKKDSLLFSNLKEGKYEITVKKENFKQSIYTYDLVCKEYNEDNFKTIAISLWKGNSEEKIIANRRLEVKTIVGDVNTAPLDKEELKRSAKAQGILNFDAVYLEAPKYPAAARAARASGIVYVQITIDEKGKVDYAKAIEGNSLLYQAAEEAAQKARFSPTMTDGKPVKITGKLVYNFLLN